MTGEVVETDTLEGEAQLFRGALGRAGRAGQEARHIDQRDLAADQRRRGRRRGRFDQSRRHRLLLFSPPTFAYPQSLSVGATGDASDTRAYFSDWGTWVNVAAPGLSLTTAYLTAFGSYTGGFGGTSGATPHVAGIAGLLFAADPSATPDEVRAAIEDSSALLPQAPYGTWTNYGRVDADAALDRILGITSGSVPARFRFAAPCGGESSRAVQAELGPNRNHTTVDLEVCGVGLESPNTIQVLSGAKSLDLVLQGRHSVVAHIPGTINSAFQLKRNAALVGSWTWDAGPGLLFAATDGCTEDTAGSTATGGWLELYRQDGVNFTCTEDSSS